jgi:hypothetical protein
MWDRSIGPVTSDSAGGKPYQWQKAGKLANSGWAGTGTAEALVYDEAGNLLDLQTTKVGACSNGASSCTVRFIYAYDEVGRLNRGSRIEGGTTVADLAFTYDQHDDRVVKADRSSATSNYTVYVFGTLELRRATYNTSAGDFLLDGTTETPLLAVAGEGVGRVSYENNGDGEPRIGGNRQHVLLNLGEGLARSSRDGGGYGYR